MSLRGVRDRTHIETVCPALCLQGLPSACAFQEKAQAFWTFRLGRFAVNILQISLTSKFSCSLQFLGYFVTAAGCASLSFMHGDSYLQGLPGYNSSPLYQRITFNLQLLHCKKQDGITMQWLLVL